MNAEIHHNKMRTTNLAFATFRTLFKEAQTTYGTANASAATTKTLHVIVEGAVKRILSQVKTPKKTIRGADVKYVYDMVKLFMDFQDDRLKTPVPKKMGRSFIRATCNEQRVADDVSVHVEQIYKWCICYLHHVLKESGDESSKFTLQKVNDALKKDSFWKYCV